MKINLIIVVLLTTLAQIQQNCKCDTAEVQNTDEIRLTNDQGWGPGSDTEMLREENEGEIEINKRVRNRGGSKRRRRLRQRHRTTTTTIEYPQQENESTDELHTSVITTGSLERNDNDEVIHKRRQNGKRRRRPLRRYNDTEHPGLRPRRRKINRKRVRPQMMLNADDIETTTYISLDYDTPITINDTINSTEQTPTNYNVDKNNNKQPEFKINKPEIHQQIISDNQEHNDLTILQTKLQDKEIEKEINLPNNYGNKIFDRKILFSNSRKLPETSATLRRRLNKPKLNSSIITFDNNVRIIKPLSNLENELENKIKVVNNENILLPPGFIKQPEIIEPYLLINSVINNSNQIVDYEEPNYPKLELFIKKNKTLNQLEIEDAKQSITSTENYITTTEVIDTTTFVPENDFNLKLINTEINNNTNITRFDDELFELLETETGTNRLKKILEIRNMTLIELLDHRERGSNKFHLSEIFSNKQQQKEIKELNKTNNLLDLLEITTINNVINSTMSTQVQSTLKPEDKEILLNSNRESRVFDSLPEFTSIKPTPIDIQRPYPKWRIIPNPKLKPVSIRGDYKEIKISNVLTTTTIKTLLENDIDSKINLLEDNDNFINQKIVEENLNNENNGRKFLFKKIPVSLKSAIVLSAAILVLAIFGFLSVLVSCRLRQKKARLRAKQDILCEHMQNEDFMASQHSLSPVLNKHNRGPVFTHGVHTDAASNRHYYLWRTLRKTFQYD